MIIRCFNNHWNTCRSEGLARTRLFHPWGREPEGGGGQAPALRVARCQTWSGVGPKTGPKLTKTTQKLSKSAKVNMLKSGDVSFDLGFERGRMSATGYVAKISMLRLNIGSGMLRLSSCMLSIGRGPKAVQGKGGAAPPCLVRIWVRGQC